MEWLEISLADEDTAGTPAGTADPHTGGGGGDGPHVQHAGKSYYEAVCE